MSLEILTQTSNHILLGLALNQLVLQSKQCRGLHGVEDSGLECTVGVHKLLLDIGNTLVGHLLILGTVTTCGNSHIAHHLGVDYPIAGAQIVPIADSLGTKFTILVDAAARALQRLVAQPVTPLIVTILGNELLVVELGLVDMVHEEIHCIPVLIYNLLLLCR